MKNLARWIVARYPRQWRERYEDEVLDLIESAPVSLHEVGELFRTMLVERVRAGIDVERPEAAITELRRLKIGVAAVGCGVSAVGGLGLRWWRPMTEHEVLWTAVAVVIYATLLSACWIRHRRHVARTGETGSHALPAAVAAACIVMQLTLSAAYWWLMLSAPIGASLFLVRLYNTFYLGAWSGVPLVWLLTQIWPGQKLVGAITDFEVARNGEAAARGFVESCEEWIARGVASPLLDAQSHLAEWTAKREAAATRLKALGYRAAL